MTIWPWGKIQVVPPVNIPIPTKMDQKGWCSYPKMVPLEGEEDEKHDNLSGRVLYLIGQAKCVGNCLQPDGDLAGEAQASR